MSAPRADGEAWDVVVVGAGPAGSSAALAALTEDPALRVLLLDRSDFPREKSCGDGIAPHVLDVLGEPRLNPRPRVEAGLLAEDAAELLRAFFSARRTGSAD